MPGDDFEKLILPKNFVMKKTMQLLFRQGARKAATLASRTVRAVSQYYLWLQGAEKPW